MNENNNKSDLSNQSFRENFFLSQIDPSKSKFLKSKLSKKKIVTQSNPNFISFWKIDEENIKFNERKNHILLQRSPKAELLKKIETPKKKKTFSINIFDGSELKLENYGDFFSQTKKYSESLRKNIYLKYMNFQTPKNLFENNENLNVKEYDYEKNISLTKYYKKYVNQWKDEHHLYILQGLINKKAKPVICRSHSKKTELSLKKVDLSHNIQNDDLMNYSNKQKKETRKMIKKTNLLNINQQPSVEFNGQLVPISIVKNPKETGNSLTPTSHNKDFKKSFKFKHYLPKITKNNKLNDNLLDGILQIK